MRFVLIALVAFIAMEFVSYLAHRFVYHGFLWFIHKSHHRPRKGRFEWNDLFPLVFASLTIVLIAIGASESGPADLLALGIGITAYGAVYLTLHDLYVHRRMKRLVFRNSYLLRMKKAHMIHHAYGGEPYGLLFFPLPSALREEMKKEEGV